MQTKWSSSVFLPKSERKVLESVCRFVPPVLQALRKGSHNGWLYGLLNH